MFEFVDNSVFVDIVSILIVKASSTSPDKEVFIEKVSISIGSSV